MLWFFERMEHSYVNVFGVDMKRDAAALAKLNLKEDGSQNSSAETTPRLYRFRGETLHTFEYLPFEALASARSPHSSDVMQNATWTATWFCTWASDAALPCVPAGFFGWFSTRMGRRQDEARTVQCRLLPGFGLGMTLRFS